MNQLNEHLLHVLSNSARSGLDSPDVLAGNSSLLASLDVGAAQRAAQIPVLLMDLNFADLEWWKAAADAKECQLQQMGVHLCPYSWQPGATREVLLLAWSVAREDGAAARLLFGMTGPVTEVIGSLGPHQLGVIATHFCWELKPRWADACGFWRQLLSASMAGNERVLTEVNLHALRMLGGEVLKASRRESRTAQRVPIVVAGRVSSH